MAISPSGSLHGQVRPAAQPGPGRTWRGATGRVWDIVGSAPRAGCPGLVPRPGRPALQATGHWLDSGVGRLADGVHHGPEVLERRVQLDVMRGPEDEPATPTDGLEA